MTDLDQDDTGGKRCTQAATLDGNGECHVYAQGSTTVGSGRMQTVCVVKKNRCSFNLYVSRPTRAGYPWRLQGGGAAATRLPRGQAEPTKAPDLDTYNDKENNDTDNDQNQKNDDNDDDKYDDDKNDDNHNEDSDSDIDSGDDNDDHENVENTKSGEQKIHKYLLWARADVRHDRSVVASQAGKPDGK